MRHKSRHGGLHSRQHGRLCGPLRRGLRAHGLRSVARAPADNAAGGTVYCPRPSHRPRSWKARRVSAPRVSQLQPLTVAASLGHLVLSFTPAGWVRGAFRAACIPVCTACCMAAVLCTTDYELRSGDAYLRCARCGKSYGSVALLQPRPHARRNAARQGEPCFPGRSVRMRATATQSADRTDIVLSN